MKKIFILFLFLLAFGSRVYASPSTSLSITPSATDGTTISASDENTRNSAVTTWANAHDHNDIDQTGNTLSVGDATAGNKTIQANNADTNKPFIRYDDTNNRFVISQNGTDVEALVSTSTSTGNFNLLPSSPTVNAPLRWKTIGGWTADTTFLSPATTGMAMISTLTTNDVDVVNSVWGVSNGIRFEGATANGNETTLSPADPSGTHTLTLPAETGTILTTATTRFIVGTFDRDMTAVTGGVSYTGVGFTPKAIIFLGTDNAITGSWGFSDDTTEGIVFNDDGTTTLSTDTVAIRISEGVGARQVATVSSFDSDGFTLSWTKTGTPTGTATIKYLAFR